MEKLKKIVSTYFAPAKGNLQNRWHLLDGIRGLTLISMMLYHVCWDLVSLYHLPIPWFRRWPGRLWQQSICWTFILLSGFCWGLGKRALRRGLTVLLAGELVTVVTAVAMPQARVRFGVLTCLGSCMLLLLPLRRALDRIPAGWGLGGSALLFLICYPMRTDGIGFGLWRIASLPRWLYQNELTAYFGFPPADFVSGDYFPLLPWIFLFLTGWFLYRLTAPAARNAAWLRVKWPLLCFLGRHSLLIYLLHQPLIYSLLALIFS